MPSASLIAPGVTMTADDFVVVNFRLWRQQPATRRNYWLLGAALLLLSIAVALDVVQNHRISNPSTLAFLAVGVLYGLFRMSLVRYQLRRGYERNAVLRAPTDFTFDVEFLRGQTSNGRFEARWTTMRRAVWVKPNWLLLYPTEAACYYVDLRRIQAPAALEQLLALVREAGIAVREV
ncbi:hypothetical protein [Hymenobacter sp. YC55]|uniref:hypothetical protein n=1 Tax=Hymenobacter sp. YC55 TaxID=3034019 RepID=UPI0023F680F7|nr:hypothetical protein [Hymenobacter sp. YC55]MDF7810359.1 hypothetical protein [Hymenobacter sp. YC55]